MRVLSIVALVGFIAAVAVHALTFFGISTPAAWPLHVGVFVVFIPMVFAMRARGESGIGDMFARLPAWARVLGFAAFAYAMVNFSLSFGALRGNPEKTPDGKYVIKNHGRLIQELDEHEYRLALARQQRGLPAKPRAQIPIAVVVDPARSCLVGSVERT